MRYSPTSKLHVQVLQSSDSLALRQKPCKSTDYNDQNSSTVQRGVDDPHNQMISVNSNEDHLQSKVSEENTFTIKMSEANEKEKRLLKKLERV